MRPESVPFGTWGKVSLPESFESPGDLMGITWMEEILDDEVPRDQALSQPLMEAQVVSDSTPTDLKSTKMTGKQQHIRPTLSSAILE